MKASSSLVRYAGVALGVLLLAVASGAQTSQDFQSPMMTPYVATAGSTVGPAVVAGLPAEGNFIRLVTGSGTAGTNTIAFERTDPGAFTTIVADFDFRMTPGAGQGMGFALLNTASYEKAGGVAGPAEEPNFAKSLGIGFDIHQDGAEPNGNHVSVHFNNVRLTEVNAGTIVLASGDWIHAQIVIHAGGGSSDVSVTLKPNGGSSVLLIDSYPVPGLQPYEGRAYFAARRAAGDTADHDLDNVQLQFTAVQSVVGQWSGALTFPIVSIHSHMLPNGKILSWDRAWSGTDTIPRLIDADTLNVPPGNRNIVPAADPGFEIFCSGHTFTADGKLFVAGGHNGSDGNGLDTAFTYNPTTNVWTRLPDMGTVGRWYPTVTLLGNGDAVVFSGNKTNGTGVNQAVQVMQFGVGPNGTWKTLTGATKSLSLYPYFHLAPNGKVFHSGPETGTEYLDPAGIGAWNPIGFSLKGHRDYGCSVLYGTGKVLIVGGGSFEQPGDKPTASAEVIDLMAPAPAWRLVTPMSYARRQANALLLPDGTVLVTGGTNSSGFSEPAGSILAAELWDPVTETWKVLAGMNLPRLYHSETILLPDGRVLSTGSGRGGGAPETVDSEVFSPPYLFKGPGPTVTFVPALVRHGETFQVQTPDGGSVTGVSLLAATSVTHTNNMNQRILRPSFSVGIGSINVTVPVSPSICPPGPYLVFLLNAAGVPSLGKPILINRNQPPVAVSGGNLTAEAVDASGAPVMVDGTASTDPDNAITTYEWLEGMNLLATGATPTITLTPGVHTITLRVTDAGTLTGTTTFTVTITDTVDPVIQSLGATPKLLRSVTNQLMAVTLSAVVTDTVDPSPVPQVTTVTSSEPDSGLPILPSDLFPDTGIAGAMTVNLRSERFAILRRYTVTVQATDSSGNSSIKTVDVKVRGKWFP